MKRFILPGLIILMTRSCAFAEPAVPAIDKNVLAEKIKTANANVARSRVECSTKVELKNVISTETTTTSDLDANNKIVHVATEIKTFEFSLQDIFKTQAEKSIAAAKKKGASAEKIEKMQKVAESLSSGMGKMLGSFKGKKYEMFVSGNDLYIRLKDGWVRSEAPGGNAGGQDIAQQSDFLSLLSNGKMPGSLVSTLGLELLLQNTGSVTEGDCEGIPCYMLDIDTQGLRGVLTQAFLASQAQGKNKDLRAAVTSLSINLSVAKDTYLMLSATANAQMALYDPIRVGYSLQQSIDEHTAYAYPQAPIQLPPELSQAVPVKDKKELKKLLTQEMESGSFMEGTKDAQKEQEAGGKAAPEPKQP